MKTEIVKPNRDYNCRVIGQGYDTIVETLSMFIFDTTWKKLEQAKKYAQERNNGNNQAYTVKLGYMEFQIKPHGGRGASFLLSNDMYLIDITDAKQDFNISVHYRACVLWQYGVDQARKNIHEVLLKEMRPRPQPKENNAWQKISRADYAFDFYSPDFSNEVSFSIADRLIAHSSCKSKYDFKGPEEKETEKGMNGYIIGTSRSIQTITIGSKLNVEIQLYDKIAEIKARSGKYWQYDVWKQGGYIPDEALKGKDIWRLEVRFFRNHLNNWNINSFEDLQKYIGGLIQKALSTRRLVDPSNGDSNKRRWATHPLWYSAWHEAHELKDMEPIGKKQDVMCYEAIQHRNMQDFKALARRVSVIECGTYDKKTAKVFFDYILENLEKDENHDEATERYQEKFKYSRSAR